MNLGIKPPQLEIPAAEPFLNDKLGRKKHAEILTSLIADTNEPLVLAINSPWGAGKTTFVKMWKKHLSNNNYRSIYFNAWESDFSEDPLVAFIGEINQEFENIIRNQNQSSPISKAFLATKKHGKYLLQRSIPLAVKLGTSGLIDLDKAGEAEVSALAEKIASEKIETYEKDKKTIKNFKESLGTFISELKTNNPDSRSPIVFFIDELDRCRPNYAIELLERIKHLFSVEGIIFILSLDRTQLEHSVKAIYGTGMDAEGYLRRFIDIQYKLPAPDIDSYCNHLFERFGFDAYFDTRNRAESRSDRGDILDSIIGFSATFNFSLRTIEQCFTQLSIVFKSTPSDKSLYPLLVTSLIAIKAADESLYSSFIESGSDYNKIFNFIESFPGGKQFLSHGNGEYISAYLIACKYDHHKLFNIIENNTKIINDHDVDSSTRTRLSSLNDLLFVLRNGNSYNQINYVLSKIEIAEHFSFNS